MTCLHALQGLKNQTQVKLNIVSCPPVTTVLIKRPDLKYQLGFSVQNGIVSSPHTLCLGCPLPCRNWAPQTRVPLPCRNWALQTGSTLSKESPPGLYRSGWSMLAKADREGEGVAQGIPQTQTLFP